MAGASRAGHISEFLDVPPLEPHTPSCESHVNPKHRLVVTALAAAACAAPAFAGPSAVTGRAVQDRRDQVGPYQVHVVYFVPRDARDARLDANGTLDSAVGRMQTWFRAASGGLSWRIDTYGPGRQTDVTFVRGKYDTAHYRATSGSVFSGVTAELESAGMSVEKTNKRYLVFFAGGTRDDGLCGIADYPVYAPRAYTPARDRAALLGGSFAMVFLNAPAACKAGDFGRGSSPGWVQTSMMHELVHTEGLTPPGAPRNCDPTSVVSGGHVCGFGAASVAAAAATAGMDPERGDVMFPFINMPLSAKSLDSGHDDYFDSEVATLDLAESAFVQGPGAVPPRGPVVPPLRVEQHADTGAHR